MGTTNPSPPSAPSRSPTTTTVPSEPNHQDPSTLKSSSTFSSTSSSSSSSSTSSSVVTAIQQNVSSLVGPHIDHVKGAVNENVTPVAQEALQLSQRTVREIVNQIYPEPEPEPQKGLDPSHPDYHQIDQMHDEQVCDYLRHKHRSTASQPLQRLKRDS
ncbi:hypothetical protein N7539_006704 [Penicillium diatomitis]|uniref:Uncharacterized protein n=1 Tax=Penicillium diatomitis TaxID=2819901 RepID=A0A9W9X1R4_9EURO|nr:uncharacterized protein N7539_006704 [Penicillium diatomitis]KAJ5480810.1 hypothetical protein N7539_006704 [Penicillium diatomitis]